MHVVIDAMNVMGSRPDGWWRDRDGALRRLAAQVSAWAETTDAEVVLVADGRPVEGLAPGRHGPLEVLYARRRGRDAADDRIVELVETLESTSRGPADGTPSETPGPPDVVGRPQVEGEVRAVDGGQGGGIEVVTADRELRERVATTGVTVVGPRTFLARLTP